jgi:hypothetical protein
MSQQLHTDLTAPLDTRDTDLAIGLKAAHQRGERVIVHLGDPDTGHDWGDDRLARGFVGPTLGRRVHLSHRGGAPLSFPLISMEAACIVRVRCAGRRRGADLYVHPSYTPASTPAQALAAQERA